MDSSSLNQEMIFGTSFGIKNDDTIFFVTNKHVIEKLIIKGFVSEILLYSGNKSQKTVKINIENWKLSSELDIAATKFNIKDLDNVMPVNDTDFIILDLKKLIINNKIDVRKKT